MLLKDRFPIIGFDWDDGNRSKNSLKHGISADEIEAFLLGSVSLAEDPLHSAKERRWYAVGIDGRGRALLVVFTMRGGRLRPISARRMHAKELDWYENHVKKDG